MRIKGLKKFITVITTLAVSTGALGLFVSGGTRVNKLIAPSNQIKLTNPDQVKNMVDRHDNYNGERILTIDDKPNLLSNIYRNGKKLTVLEIVPFEAVSSFQMNANPQKFIDYWDYTFNEGDGFSQIGFNKTINASGAEYAAEIYDGNGNLVKKVQNYNAKDTATYTDNVYEWINMKFIGGRQIQLDWGGAISDISKHTLSDGSVRYTNTWDGAPGGTVKTETVKGYHIIYLDNNQQDLCPVDYPFSGYVVEHYTIGLNGRYSIADNEHKFTVTLTRYYDGREEYNGVETRNYYLDQLMGTLDKDNNLYYKFRKYFDENMEVITLRPCDLASFDFDSLEDDIDMVYIGGYLSPSINDGGSRQVVRNLMSSDYKISLSDALNNRYDNYKTGVFYKNSSGKFVEYKYSELINKQVWYDSYSYRNGAYVPNDMDWTTLKKLVNYIYGYNTTKYNYDSYVTVEIQGVTTNRYQKIPCLMEEGKSKQYPDYNMSKLIYMIQKVSDEYGTMDFLNFNDRKYNGGSIDLVNHTSLRADPTVNEAFLEYFQEYPNMYRNQLPNGQTYNGFIDFYLEETKPDGTPYYNSAGVTTAVEKTTKNSNWKASGKDVFNDIDYDGTIAITTTAVKFAADSTIMYYCYNVKDGAVQKNYNTESGRGLYYETRDMEEEEDNKIYPFAMFKYLIGLDETDVLTAPDCSFEDSYAGDKLIMDVEKTAAGSNTYATYYEKLEGITLDAEGNMIITYKATTDSGKLDKTILKYDDVELEVHDSAYFTGDRETAAVMEYKVPKSDDKNSLYYKILNGGKPVQLEAQNLVTYTKKGTQVTKNLKATASLYFVGRDIFDLD